MAPAVPGAEDRREINRWLANLYLTEVDGDAIALYRGREGSRFLTQLGAVAPLVPLVESLRGTLAGEGDPEALRLDLAVAYSRLFLVGGPQAVPPYASAYLSPKGLLMQHPVTQTEAVLARLGLTAAQGLNEPADHIGVQLGILAELAGRPEAEAEFLQEHLLTWVPAFATLCARQAPVPLYRDLARATLAWLRALEGQLAAERAGA